MSSDKGSDTIVSRDSKGSRDAIVSRGSRDRRGSRDAVVSRGSRDAVVSKGSRNAIVSRGSRDAYVSRDRHRDIDASRDDGKVTIVSRNITRDNTRAVVSNNMKGLTRDIGPCRKWV